MVPNPGQQQYELSTRLAAWDDAIARAQHSAELKQLARDDAPAAPAIEPQLPQRRPFFQALAFRLRRRSTTA